MGLICNAGFNAANVLPDGTVTICRDRRQSLGSIYTGFQFRKELVDCDFKVCQCPLWSFEKSLHAKAKGEPHEKPRYDAFLHWYPTYSCNFLCKYCIVDGTKKEDTIAKLTPAEPIDIPAVVRTLDATGMIFLLSFIGGEPFTVPNMNEVCAELTKKHYISFNTNLVALNMQFFEMVNLDRLGVMHISFHIQQLEQRGMVQMFIDKVLAMKAFGYENFFITTVADPTTFEKLPYYQELFKDNGIQFKLIPMIEGGGLYGETYPEAYTEEQLNMMKKNWLDDYYPQRSAERANSGKSGALSSSCKKVYEIDDISF